MNRPRISIFTLHTLLFTLSFLSACGSKPEDAIEDRLDELVAALNAKDEAAASRLFKGGAIPPVNDAGDSSVVYRLLHIPGNEDFSLGSVTTAVIDDRARASIELHGKVMNGDSILGEMALPMKIELERTAAGEWLILP